MTVARGARSRLAVIGLGLGLGLATGCGRFDFGDQASAADAPSDAPAPFAPESGGCLQADSGPFTEVASFPTTNGGYGVWAAPPYLLMADTANGLHELRFDGSTFTEVGHQTDLGWVEDVWSDGTYAYVASPGTGFYVMQAGSDGVLAQLASNTVELLQARRGWNSGGNIYLPIGSAGIQAVHFDGSALSLVGAPIVSMSWGNGAWASGSRVVFADANDFRVLDFDGAAFHDLVPPNTTHPASTRVWSADGSTIFVANQDGATAYHFDGTTLTELDTFALAGIGRDIWSDGQHVFLADETGGVEALAFDGAHFSVVANIATGGNTLGVFGDGTYIYANDGTTGLHAFTGFACLRW